MFEHEKNIIGINTAIYSYYWNLATESCIRKF